jgi:hypothetical protein
MEYTCTPHMSSTEFWNYERTQIKAQPLSNQTSMQGWCVECWNAQQVLSNGQHAQSGLPLVSMAKFSSYIPQEHVSLTSINAVFSFITWLYVLTSCLLPNVAERPYAYESCSTAGFSAESSCSRLFTLQDSLWRLTKICILIWTVQNFFSNLHNQHNMSTYIVINLMYRHQSFTLSMCIVALVCKNTPLTWASDILVTHLHIP